MTTDAQITDDGCGCNSDDLEHRAMMRAIDRIGWDEIRAFQAALRGGQDVRDDAGGYFIRAIRALLGVPSRNPVLTYKEAALNLIVSKSEGL